MYRTKSLVAATILITFASLFVTQDDAFAWRPRRAAAHYRHGSTLATTLAAGLIGGAIASHGYRHSTYVTPTYYTSPGTTTYVDEYGRVVIVRSVYDPRTHRWYRYTQYAD